jgi:hypothetical protein
MSTVFDPFSFLVVSIAGWMNQHQQHVVQYLVEENRVLREQIGNRRLRFNDDQRRRLAVNAKSSTRATAEPPKRRAGSWPESLKRFSFARMRNEIRQTFQWVGKFFL